MSTEAVKVFPIRRLSVYAILINIRTIMRRWPVVSVTIITVLALIAILAPVVSPHPPLEHDILKRNIPPMWQEGGTATHILGTDTLGRDLLSRIIYGARVSMTIAAISLGVGIIVGSLLGFMAGYHSGTIDEVITRIVDIWQGLPYVLIALVLSLALGSGFGTVIILLALVAWVPFVRQVRGEVLSLKNRDYVMLAQVAGASIWRIFLRHLLPGVLNTIIVIATFQVGSLILLEAFLSFLGAGIQPPTPSWGNMIAEGRGYLQDAWWTSVFPGIAILLTASSLSFLGDWIRDFTDPRLRQID